jgi:hypothetical protein
VDRFLGLKSTVLALSKISSHTRKYFKQVRHDQTKRGNGNTRLLFLFQNRVGCHYSRGCVERKRVHLHSLIHLVTLLTNSAYFILIPFIFGWGVRVPSHPIRSIQLER